MNFINTDFGHKLIIDILPQIIGLIVTFAIFNTPPLKRWRKKKEKIRLEKRLEKLNEEELSIRKQTIRYQQQQPHKETYEEFKARREREQAEQQRNNGGYSTAAAFSGVAVVSSLTGLLLPLFAAGLM